MKNATFVLILILLLFISENSSAQQDSLAIRIELSNPNFEDDPRPGREPRGWYDCGAINFPEETPPDIHPVIENPSFGVDKEPKEGDTYMGLVVRNNDSWEFVSQKLPYPLFPGICYSLSGYLSQSEVYKSSVRGSDEVVNFTEPIKLRIWGGDGHCGKKELLAETSLIDHAEWKKYEFNFSTQKAWNFIILEAYFQTPTFDVPNGNILLDNFSEIRLVSCDRKNKELTSKQYPFELINLIESNRKEQLKRERKKAYEERQKAKRKKEAQEEWKRNAPLRENKIFKDKIQRKSFSFFINSDYNRQVAAIDFFGDQILENPQYQLCIYYNTKEKPDIFVTLREANFLFSEKGLPEMNYSVKRRKQKSSEIDWILETEKYGIGIKEIK